MAGTIVPATPLIIRADDGLLLFHSVGDAETYLEVPDIEDGVYGPAYDAEGRLLSIEPPAELFEEKPKRGWRRLWWRVWPVFNLVEVRLVEDEPRHRSNLIELLISELGETRSEASDLEQLLTLAVERFGIT